MNKNKTVELNRPACGVIPNPLSFAIPPEVKSYQNLTEIWNERNKEWDMPSQPMSPMIPKVLKYDQDKVRHDLVPPEAIEGMAKVLSFGAKKYSDRGWEVGMDWGRVYAALQRHMLAWWSGQSLDPETGLSHLHHASCCVAFLQTYEARNIGQDTRPKPTLNKVHGTDLN